MAADEVTSVEAVLLDVDFILDFIVAKSNNVDCVQEVLRRALIMSGF